MSLDAAPASRTLASPATAAALLNAAGAHPNRSMGQNFLVDANILRIISEAAELSPFDTVIEVGAGLGALTQALVNTVGRVYALEADSKLVGILEHQLGWATNLVLVEADAARFDYATLWDGEPPDDVKMVSNLPYQIAAMLVVDCLKRYPWIREYTVMVQREVANRLASGPGSKEYSAASVRVQVRASVSRVIRVSRNSFYPKPKVDSALLHIVRSEDGAWRGPGSGTEAFFDRVVGAAFGQRRKKLSNALSSSVGPGVSADAVREALRTLGRSGEVRAEDLSPDEFVNLASLLEKRLEPGVSSPAVE